MPVLTAGMVTARDWTVLHKPLKNKNKKVYIKLL